ncbi:MAG: glycosyltransferase family A protein [Patescibacteria group bacterium]|nr:glycosyltransferase family A protein [Patescibacteria group bacterium]
MISIIIPVYNQAKKLSQCLDSILRQTYSNYEIIIVNDGSTDNIEKVMQQQITTFGNKLSIIGQGNKGAPSARNKGFSKSQGEYILFCDADAILKPQALEVMFKTLQGNPKASYAYSSFLWGRKLFRLWPFNAKKLKTMPYIHSTSLIRREHFPAVSWDESIKKLQDWDLWLTMLEQGHIGIWINQVLFTISGGGYTMSSWLPSFTYKLLPFLPSVKKYNKAVEIIKEKHKIT